MNRLVGGSQKDVLERVRKVEIARRIVLGVNPDAHVRCLAKRWQDEQKKLRSCNVIFGCVDSYSEREQLERFCRQFQIAYIDIGMDVLNYENGFRVFGQVAQYFPRAQCLRCMAILTEESLKREAEQYGMAGSKPQAVWPNGVLASTAVSLFARLVTEWAPKEQTAYLKYNGNDSILMPSPRMKYILQETYRHYEMQGLGDPFFRLG